MVTTNLYILPKEATAHSTETDPYYKWTPPTARVRGQRQRTANFSAMTADVTTAMGWQRRRRHQLCCGGAGVLLHGRIVLVCFWRRCSGVVMNIILPRSRRDGELTA